MQTSFTSLNCRTIRDLTLYDVEPDESVMDPRLYLGLDVVIDGQPYKVRRVECFAVALPYGKRTFALGVIPESRQARGW